MIKEFQGDYRWLSNFAYVNIVFEGITYCSVEHAYMAAKSHDKGWRKFCQQTKSAGEVKKASRKICLREDWEDVKLSVMEDFLRQKFNTPKYKALLKATGSVHIQEGNMWGDKYWGVCLKTNSGHNHLGKLIMKIREEIRGENCG